MADVALLASYWTIAGAAVPLSGSEVSPHALPDRLDAAEQAGYVGFGFNHEDLMHSLERYGRSRVSAMIKTANMKSLELEMLSDWFAAGQRRKASDAARADLLEAAGTFGASHIKCGGPNEGEDYPVEHLAEEFAKLCDEAAEMGAAVALEPMPFTAVKDPQAALAFIDLADRRNGGLCVDIWHVARAGIPYEELSALPKRSLVAVEIDDADREPVGTLLEDTLDRRRLCGEGDLDVPAFRDAIAATGFDGPYGVEIISDKQRALPLAEAAQAAFRTARDQLMT